MKHKPNPELIEVLGNMKWRCPNHLPVIKDDWTMPAPPAALCGSCDKPLDLPIALNEGDGWELLWECQEQCGDSYDDEYRIAWPFVDDATGDGDDLEKLGFTVV